MCYIVSGMSDFPKVYIIYYDAGQCPGGMRLYVSSSGYCFLSRNVLQILAVSRDVGVTDLQCQREQKELEQCSCVPHAVELRFQFQAACLRNV